MRGVDPRHEIHRSHSGGRFRNSNMPEMEALQVIERVAQGDRGIGDRPLIGTMSRTAARRAGPRGQIRRGRRIFFSFGHQRSGPDELRGGFSRDADEASFFSRPPPPHLSWGIFRSLGRSRTLDREGVRPARAESLWGKRAGSARPGLKLGRLRRARGRSRLGALLSSP
jgi:hypothetical protein